MNKKQEAALMADMKKLEVELAMHRAMRISEPVEPDVPPPGGYPQPPTNGWLPFFHHNSYSASIGAMKASSTSQSHRTGDDAWDHTRHRTGSQQSRWLYSTEALAWRQARYMASMEYAKQLAMADAAIEKAERG